MVAIAFLFYQCIVLLSLSGRLPCHSRKHLQTISTTEILFNILAASICMMDFFFKSKPASNFCNERKSALKPGLHMVLTIAEHASDVATKRILRLSIHRLQTFLAKYEYMQSSQLCEDQGIREKLKLDNCKMQKSAAHLGSLV